MCRGLVIAQELEPIMEAKGKMDVEGGAPSIVEEIAFYWLSRLKYFNLYANIFFNGAHSGNKSCIGCAFTNI